jgi:hypothetical protein
MDKFELGITKESNDGYQALLNAKQSVPNVRGQVRRRGTRYRRPTEWYLVYYTG